MLQRRMSVGDVSERSSSGAKGRGRRTGQMVVTREKKDVAAHGGVGRSVEKGVRRGKEDVVLASDYDEMDAPWNQYAWMEEMQLRVSHLSSIY